MKLILNPLTCFQKAQLTLLEDNISSWVAWTCSLSMTLRVALASLFAAQNRILSSSSLNMNHAKNAFDRKNWSTSFRLKTNLFNQIWTEQEKMSSEQSRSWRNEKTESSNLSENQKFSLWPPQAILGIYLLEICWEIFCLLQNLQFRKFKEGLSNLRKAKLVRSRKLLFEFENWALKTIRF